MRLGTICPELNTYAGECFTEFMRLIYLSRPDIQKRFSLDDIFSRTILLAWYHTQGYKDIRMFATDLPQPQWDLLSEKCEETGSIENHSFTKMQAVLWSASSFAKDAFNLDLLNDRLSIELMVATCVPKPQGVSLVPPSNRALLFANTLDTDFTVEIPIPVCQLLSSVWKARKDLQIAFPCDSKESEAALVLWFLNHGRKELDLSGLDILTIDRQYLLSESQELHSGTNLPIPRILHQIWCSSHEFQSQYNLYSLKERLKFLNWFKDSGIVQYGLEWLFAESPFSISTKSVSLEADLPKINQNDSQLGTGVNVIGNAQGGFGMSQHAIMTARAIQSANIPCCIVDMNDTTSIESCDAEKLGCTVVRNCLYSLNIGAFTPTMLPHEFGRIGLSVIEQCHNIYYGNWEYQQYPADHITVIESFDEVWAPSKFTFDALKNIISKPLYHIPLSVTISNLATKTRADFNLPADSFLFINTFDYHSGIMRKNPHACVQAFMQAFPQGNEKVGLIIKATNISNHKTEGLEIWTKLKEIAQTDSRIFVIEQQLTRHEIDNLVNLCDAFISLHRAEGFGLAIAEAMLMAKPVIVTNYSGNTDFTLPSNSCLVDSILVRPPQSVIERLGVETIWAEPDISHAAWYMQKLVREQDYKNELSKAGHQFILENHSPVIVGKIIKERLRKLNHIEK